MNQRLRWFLTVFLLLFVASGCVSVPTRLDLATDKTKEVLRYIDDYYYKEVDLDKCAEQILCCGLSRCTDRYSCYLPKSKTDGDSSINSKTVYYKELQKGIGGVWIKRFASTTAIEFFDEVDALGIGPDEVKVLILDLRNNPGGFVNSALDILYLFERNLTTSLIYYKYKTGDAQPYYWGLENAEWLKSKSGLYSQLRIVVLANENTASAAEIMTAWFKEGYGAPVIGKTTYGKGVAQGDYVLSDGSILRLTTAEFFIGKNKTKIHGVGVVPTIEVEVADLQFKKAMEIAKRMLR